MSATVTPVNSKHRKTYKVFVSGRYASRQRAADFVTTLVAEENGAVCPLYWFLHNRDDDQLSTSEKLGLSTTIMRAIRECDYFVHLHENVPQRGGNLVELGMALAFNKTVVAVLPHGPHPSNLAETRRVPLGGVFHELPQVHVCSSDGEALATLCRWIERKSDPSPAARGVQTLPVHVAEDGSTPGEIVFGTLGSVPVPHRTNSETIGQVDREGVPPEPVGRRTLSSLASTGVAEASIDGLRTPDFNPVHSREAKLARKRKQ